MAKTLLDKMFFKPEYAIAALHVPTELKISLSLTSKIDSSLKRKYDFILAFYSSKAALRNEIVEMKKSLVEKGLLWIAYPKARALQTDLNRNILHEAMQDLGFDGVSLISLNATWSAMRFKNL